MNKKTKEKIRIFSMYPITVYDIIWDTIICRTSLHRYVPSKYRESHGATGSESTRYMILHDIFKGEKFNKDDVFIDVGCGKGRVIAYMLRRRFPGKLKGIELNDDVAKICRSWAKRYDNVEVISGNAFDYSYEDITVMFMGRPFLPDMFAEFIGKLEKEMKHKLRFYYWVDQTSGGYLENREGWTLIKRKQIYRKYGIFKIAATPQRFSVWEYNPVKEEENEKMD